MTTLKNIDQFQALGLSTSLLRAIQSLGYETPSPIQKKSIPVLMSGADVLGQAQTGTGKTAAFVLPMLDQLDLEQMYPQMLVLTPTRELAIQVSESVRAMARFMPNFHVLPIYGGQAMTHQLRSLKRGPQTIVGTPGRVLDHVRRKSLKLDRIKMVVLDEADEMLRMGFLDDVETILGQCSEERQTALFSATMPPPIARIARSHLRDPVEIRIPEETVTVQRIRQRYWLVEGVHKLDALTRILEVEDMEAALIFVRTKTGTQELQEKLDARGYSTGILHGDMNQAQREKAVASLKNGAFDLLVATDVAARGLDVARISHVINYDMPYDVQSYVHRIGRTGRAGREGDAVLFVAPRERRLLRAIEQSIGRKIDRLHLPTASEINERKVERVSSQLATRMLEADLDDFKTWVADFCMRQEEDPLDVAATLAALAFPKLVSWMQAEEEPIQDRGHRPQNQRSHSKRNPEHRGQSGDRVPMGTYRVEVGSADGATARQIVGAIANETGLDGEYIGRITIHENYSIVTMPAEIPNEVLSHLQKIRVCGRPLKAKAVAATGAKVRKDRKKTKTKSKGRKKS